MCVLTYLINYPVLQTVAPPIATDPVIPVCLFPAVLHFSKPTKRKRERVRNRFVKGKLTKRESLREKERQRGTMAATRAATCLFPLYRH